MVREEGGAPENLGMLTQMPGWRIFAEYPRGFSVAFECVGWYPMDINLKFVASEMYCTFSFSQSRFSLFGGIGR